MVLLELSDIVIVYSSPREGESRYLASSSKDSTVRVWDTHLYRCTLVLSGHLHSVTCVKWGGEGLLYSASQDRTIKVWRPTDVCKWEYL